jgi:demethylmenaquinone methyltransferase/2-methoxy-6-polyprenyl-1,4-benzoquinol methylase
MDQASSQNAEAMRSYYSQRAPQYEEIYQRPERQGNLTAIKDRLSCTFAGQSVLDVACGTGYFSAVMAPVARQLTGIDISAPVLELARQKNLPRARFDLGDAMRLDPSLGLFDAAFLGFWWSHIGLEELDAFIAQLHARLRPGARVVILDNLFVPGHSTPLKRQDAHGNTWQQRVTADGSIHEVMKNYPRYEFLLQRLRPFASTYWWCLDYYWWFEYNRL